MSKWAIKWESSLSGISHIGLPIFDSKQKAKRRRDETVAFFKRLGFAYTNKYIKWSVVRVH